jgi:hypothetical protein
MRATIVGAVAGLLLLMSACGSSPPPGDAADPVTPRAATTAPAPETTSPDDTTTPAPPSAEADAGSVPAPDPDARRWVEGVPGGVDIELLDPARFSVDEWFVVDDDGRRAAGRRGADELCAVDLESDGSAPARCVEVPPHIVDAIDTGRYVAVRWPSEAPLAMTLTGSRDGATGAEAFTLSTSVVDFVAGTVTPVAGTDQGVVLGVSAEQTVTLRGDGLPSEPVAVREVGLDGVERRMLGALVLGVSSGRQGGDGSLFVVGSLAGDAVEAGRSVARISGDGISAVAATEASTAIHDASDSGQWALVVDRRRLNQLEPAPLVIVDPVAGTTVELPLPTVDSLGFPNGWFADDDRLVVGWWSELPSGRWALGVLEIDADGRPLGDWHELGAWSRAESDRRPDACSPPGGAAFVGASGDVAVMELTRDGATTLCRVRLGP